MISLIISGERVHVDREDLPRLLERKWHISTNRAGIHFVRSHENGKYVLMYRYLLSPSGDQHVDHVNGNRLDNRRANLRLCSHAENMRNRKRHKNNRSGFKGVYYHRSRGRYIAEITVNKRKFHLGSFEDPSEAHKAYVIAAKKFHGSFARTA